MSTYPKYLLITGVNGGIGQAILQRMASHGSMVIGIDLTITEQKLSPTVYMQQCDIGDPAQVKALWSKLAKENIKIDGLVNNAGVYPACQWKD